MECIFLLDPCYYNNFLAVKSGIEFSFLNFEGREKPTLFDVQTPPLFLRAFQAASYLFYLLCPTANIFF